MRHAQIGEFPTNLIREIGRMFFTCRGELSGSLAQALKLNVQPCFTVGQMSVEIQQSAQLCLHFFEQREHALQVFAVLALQAVKAVQPIIQLGQSLRVTAGFEV